MNLVMRGPLYDNNIIKQLTHALSKLYKNSTRYRKIIRPFAKWRAIKNIGTSRFDSTNSRGKVVVDYVILDGQVNVTINLKHLTPNWKSVTVLNEQGASIFTRYIDTVYNILEHDSIGIWSVVEAEEACFTNSNNTLKFCLKWIPKSRLIRGREYLKDYLSWAGFAYQLYPSLYSFQYNITI